jgi:hypothetical protein
MTPWGITPRSSTGLHGRPAKQAVHVNFAGGNDVVDADSPAVFDNMGAVTISAWINPATLGDNNRGRIVSKARGGNLPSLAGRFISLQKRAPMQSNLPLTTALHTLSTPQYPTLSSSTSGSMWQLRGMAQNKQQTLIYVNGVEVTYGVTDNAVGTRSDDDWA